MYEKETGRLVDEIKKRAGWHLEYLEEDREDEEPFTEEQKEYLLTEITKTLFGEVTDNGVEKVDYFLDEYDFVERMNRNMVDTV